MIVDLQRFIDEERPCWDALDELLRRFERDPHLRLDLAETRRFQYLYERASADLARLASASAEAELKRYLESLVARAFGEIHETRGADRRFQPLIWFFHTFPQTFRRHLRAFHLAVLITLAGSLFGAFAVAVDPSAKSALLPFPHLLQDPSERVAHEEEAGDSDRLKGAKGQFSTYLMTHNTKVAILTLALGMSYGIGSLIIIFFNGVILGAVVADYVLGGEAVFLIGWLLPHGSVEIPAFLLAGQAGIVLAGAMIGWGKRLGLKDRLRQVSGDLVTLIGGIALMLLWAGIVEACMSQYHEPVLPYWVKITFGTAELILLILFLTLGGTSRNPAATTASEAVGDAPGPETGGGRI